MMNGRRIEMASRPRRDGSGGGRRLNRNKGGCRKGGPGHGRGGGRGSGRGRKG